MTRRSPVSNRTVSVSRFIPCGSALIGRQHRNNDLFHRNNTARTSTCVNRSRRDNFHVPCHGFRCSVTLFSHREMLLMLRVSCVKRSQDLCDSNDSCHGTVIKNTIIIPSEVGTDLKTHENKFLRTLHPILIEISD